MIGLGRMGANLVRRLLRAGQPSVVFDTSPQAVDVLVQERAVASRQPPVPTRTLRRFGA